MEGASQGARTYYFRLDTQAVEDAESVTIDLNSCKTVSDLKDALVRSKVFAREGLVHKGDIRSINFAGIPLRSHLRLASSETIGLKAEATLHQPLLIALAKKGTISKRNRRCLTFRQH